MTKFFVVHFYTKCWSIKSVLLQKNISLFLSVYEMALGQ